jgi:3',5'-cyclic AMP phosphodiesterase CpdA
MHALPRRAFLRHGGALTLGAALAVSPASHAARPVAAPRRRVLRLAHLTDIHVLPNAEGLQDPVGGMAAAIRHAQSQADKPDLLFFGGDLIMDSLKLEKEKVLAQWDTWEKVISAELKLPSKLCLGNHDIFGWAIRDQPGLARDPHFGKALALERLGMKDRFYSFDQAGWHFVVLDSMQPDYANKHGYTARIDDEQFAWLARDLIAAPAGMPVCVLSHIPILSACVFFDDDLESTGSWVIPGAWTHIDARRLKNLFRAHPNVKVCLSGHVHLADDLTYLGVRYLCNGAVSGGWWKGDYQEFAPAYALVDFHDDGSVENQLVYYRKA